MVGQIEKTRIQELISRTGCEGYYLAGQDEMIARDHSHAHDMTCSGLLVQSDNLEFLRANQELLRNAVRVIYIDPPYNTGNRQQAYRDSFERQEWLEYMRTCLELSLPLMRNDGSIFVSIDDSLMPWLRIMMDEVFGQETMVACVAYERSGSAGLGQGGTVVNTKEYVLFYCLDKSSLNEVGYERELDYETMKRYKKVMNHEGDRTLIAEIESGSGSLAFLYEHNGFNIESISLKDFNQRKRLIDAEYLDSFAQIFRTQNVQRENKFQNDIIQRLSKGSLYSVDYVPSRGRYRGQDKRLYYWNKELCAWLKDSSFKRDGRIVKTNKLTDFWSHAEIPKADLANEGGINFKRSKKPEHLLHRLLALASNEGDLVLDYFLGSGTTSAVAHKMNRQYIGIENGDYFQACPVKRMCNVLNGDPTGISKLVSWKGGGAFAVKG
ncbi:MAG: site-specific DNA-methyltransferase [Cyanobacteria bacterium]|nr:site-specific DNA-methyltransferase [Cyanobacteriota bacterium]